MFHSNRQLKVVVPEIMYDKFRDAPPLLTNGAFRLRKMNIILLFYSIKYFGH